MKDKISEVTQTMIVKEGKCLSKACFDDMTLNEMYTILTIGKMSDEVLEAMLIRLRPLILKMAQGYMNLMSMDENDMCQEAMILLWKIIMKGSYNPAMGKFSSFFYKCWDLRLKGIWQKFILKNPVPLSYEWEWNYKEPLGDCVLQWNDHAEKIRSQIKERNRRYHQQKKEKAA